VLLSGTKVRDRMLSQGLIRPDNHRIVGYPKFEAVNARGAGKKRLFENDNPTVLYNPHFDARLSSWYRFGQDILEFFAARPHLNLIVAPHIMLFKKKLHISLQSGSFRLTKRIPAKYFNCPNIHIDTGSSASVDMTYTGGADVYLGDVSSQVYEFLIRPRPCIFLNSHAAEWKNDANYRHWNLGPVLDSLSSLEKLLSCSPIALHGQFIDRQLQAARETFDTSEVASSTRAANAIVHYIRANPAVKTSPSKPITRPAGVYVGFDPTGAGILN